MYIWFQATLYYFDPLCFRFDCLIHNLLDLLWVPFAGASDARYNLLLDRLVINLSRIFQSHCQCNLLHFVQSCVPIWILIWCTCINSMRKLIKASKVICWVLGFIHYLGTYFKSKAEFHYSKTTSSKTRYRVVSP